MSEHDLALLACYAHPDDEQGISGTLAKAVQYGHRVGLLMSTRGEVGEIAPGVEATPETLGAVREREMLAAAAVIGIPPEHVFFLDYRDSGMVGTPPNEDPRASMNADEHEAVGHIVRVIRQFRPAVLITFDEGGGYGHPDHLAVHRWTTRAYYAAGQADMYEEAGPPFAPARLFYASFPRSAIGRMVEWMRDNWSADEQRPFAQASMDPNSLGMPDEMITNRVDVHEFVDLKRQSIEHHASQMNPNSPFARMPEEITREFRGHESFHLAAGVPFGPADDAGDLFAGLG